MKKIMSISLIIIMVCLCFVGCAKCIGTETNIEQVEIVDTTIEKNTYDDGTIKYLVIELE